MTRVQGLDMHLAKSDLEPSRDGGSAPTASGTTGSHGERRRWWLWLPVFCLIGVTAYVLLPRIGQVTSQSRKAAATPGILAVPVVATTARQGNMGIYLTGLGSVTAFNTVTVRTRVDGQLVKVAFQEGQPVHEGDLLAEIDPRPFQVQLTQAEGQMAKDQAQLKDAKLDLERYKVLIKQDAISKQQLDAQIATVNQAEGSSRAIRDRSTTPSCNWCIAVSLPLLAAG
jgi:membrane fusion protein, multidrug efflux system